MNHSPLRRRRQAAAVSAVLAVVTAAGVATPAMAATPTAPVRSVTDGQDTPFTLPDGSKLISAGRTGMLSATDGSSVVYRWTRFSDGVTTTLSGRRWGAIGTDTVATQNGSVITLTDMSGGSAPVEIDTSAFNTAANPYTLNRVVGSTLVMTASVSGVLEYHLVSKEEGRVVDRKVVLPEGARPLVMYSNGPGTYVLTYNRVVGEVWTRHVAVLDPATGAATDTYDTLPSTVIRAGFLSPTHVAWTETPAGGTAILAVARRGGTRTERTPLDPLRSADGILLRTVGDWLTYNRNGGGTAGWTDALHPLTARSLTNGDTVEVLDHVQSSAVDPDGNLLALGGTVEHGEGLYRVAPGADGTPVATLVTSFGRPTALTMENETLPPTGAVDFDTNGGVLKASGKVSRSNARVGLSVTHVASGLTGGAGQTLATTATDFALTWNGQFQNGVPAYNGDYTWTLTAKPTNGIGPDVVRTGTFTLTRAPKAHDFDDNGSPDLLARDGRGRLRSYDINQIEGSSTIRALDPVDLGTGWSGYDRITAAGDIAGTTAPDLVARDRTGVLWLHQGNGKGLAPRTRIGAGWQIYHTLTAGSDVTGDGRPDLLATDTSGALWLYKATGDTAAPFAKRVKVGGGWGVYNQLTATGNIAGAPAGDLLARDTSGTLWLYLGKGDGTFAPRVKVGGGWNAYVSLVGAGDVDRDGRNDLIAYNANGGFYSSLYVYKGTGNWNAPFGTRRAPYNPGLGEGSIDLF
ncbi:FG-GAP repeat domain-containing protein [Streptomyces flavochromogenes]|uniref:FG-GAP repeat domain-containing protein n=1 Tax=Streptomyces flavochromogenes TaxID=68199 RepID=A0ABW6XK74_9ACTN|nr:VCBS repeat-containing protein [Streptomyces flavochromogenes]